MVTLEERVTRLESAYEQFVTLVARVDLLPTREEMQAEIRAHVKESENRMIKWMIGLTVAQTGIIVGAITAAVAIIKLA